MIIRYLALCTALVVPRLADASSAGHPLPAPSKYASSNYAVAFDVPPNTTYCPLPADWVGSDHGTTIFLAPPKRCGGAGYPSSSRGFEPARTPRIEIYYGYADSDSAPAPCHLAGHARLFDREEALCGDEQDGMAILTVHGTYEADEPAEIQLSLVASAQDQPLYRKAFLALAASVHACKASWPDSRNPKQVSFIGHGPPCDARWF